jgi:hypothetical protein
MTTLERDALGRVIQSTGSFRYDVLEEMTEAAADALHIELTDALQRLVDEPHGGWEEITNPPKDVKSWLLRDETHPAAYGLSGRVSPGRVNKKTGTFTVAVTFKIPKDD